MKVEDQFTDVLQNIERAIVRIYQDCPELTDQGVMLTLEAVVDAYAAETIGRPPRTFNLSDHERLLMDNIRSMCEWRLGRSDPADAPTDDPQTMAKPEIVDEIVLCLKRILKSARKWNKSGGRQGYLNFIVRFVR